MIELYQYESLHDKTLFIEGLDLRTTTLLVSDLASKLSWQDFFIQKTGFLDGPQILRAEDLWKIVLQRVNPEANFISISCLSSHVKSLLTNDWARQLGLPYVKPATALRAINELLPILCHPDSTEIMEHWFEEIHHGPCSWRNWYYLASLLWNELKKNHLILDDWSAALLTQYPGFENYWNRDLIVDLGPEIRTIEVELLQSLSQKRQVGILAPKPSFLPNFPWISYPYEQFIQRSHQTTAIPKQKKSLTNNSFKRFTAPLAEIKFAIGQIQTWLTEGKSLEEIAIIAPNIEDYWPVLRWHLKMENIPFDKPESTQLGSLGPILAWIAKLKKLCGIRLSSGELELADFHVENYQQANYLHHLSKWGRRTYVSSDVPTDIASSSAEDFLNWASQYWPMESLLTEHLLEICGHWLLEARLLEPRHQRDWLDYLADFLNHQELELHPAQKNSLGVYSLMSGIPQHRKLHIFLGCSESQLKASRGFLKGSDVLSLQHHTGHLLAHPDRDFREYQLNMLLDIGVQQFFTFAESDFSGTELVPSLFWLNGREKSSQDLHNLDSWNLGVWESFLLNTLPTPIPALTIIPKLPWKISLSPATLKSYLECPFKFFVEKALRLSDPAIVDLDLDARTQGSLHHRLLELLVQEPFDATALKAQLSDSIEQAIADQKDSFFSEQTKALVKTQLETFGLRFLAHEEAYRKEFPFFYTFAREVKFKRNLLIDGTPIVFSGKIDRIDMARDHSGAIVIDYKSDFGSRHHAAKSWLEHREYQLLAYTDSIEVGAVDFNNSGANSLTAVPVIAAHYYNLKNFSRRGFTLEQIPPGLVTELTSQNRVSTSEKTALLDEFNSALNETAKKIIEGDFRPIPHPKTDCPQCRWRYLCRSPHQNL